MNIATRLKTKLMAAVLLFSSCLPQYGAVSIGSHKTRGDMPSANLTTLRYGQKRDDHEKGFGFETSIGFREKISFSVPADAAANEPAYDAEHSAVVLEAIAKYYLVQKGPIRPSFGAGFSFIAEQQTTDVHFGAPTGTQTNTENPSAGGLTANVSIDILIKSGLSAGTSVGATKYFGDHTDSQNTSYAAFDITYSF
jgi:hypothetical protein